MGQTQEIQEQSCDDKFQACKEWVKCVKSKGGEEGLDTIPKRKYAFELAKKVCKAISCTMSQFFLMITEFKFYDKRTDLEIEQWIFFEYGYLMLAFESILANADFIVNLEEIIF